MAYKMKGFGGFGNSPAKDMKTGKYEHSFESPAKQKADTTKTYPKSYTKKDIEFLKQQREDVVRYEDLDEKGKAIWKKQGKPVPKKKKSKIKKKSPAKQQGPIDEKQTKLQPSEHKDTYVTKDKSKREKIIGLEDRIEFINEDIFNSGEATTQQKKDKAKLNQELAILRKSKHK